MTTLFNKLFIETRFDAISQKDIEAGMIAGVASPYLGSPKDEIGITLDDIDKDFRILSNKVSKLHNRYGMNIKNASASDMTSFAELLDRLVRALDENKIFSDDPVIQVKLAELFAYAYVKISSQDATYMMYDKLEQAKKVANMIFNKAKGMGLTFFSPSSNDLLKTVILAVFYKLPKEKKAGDNQQQPPAEQAPLSQPPA